MNVITQELRFTVEAGGSMFLFRAFDPDGEFAATWEVPLAALPDQSALENPTHASLCEAGARVGDALAPGPVLRWLAERLPAESRRPVLLRLCLAPGPAEEVPWETARVFLRNGQPRFLARTPGAAMLRQSTVAGPSNAAGEGSRRVLLAWADPGGPGLPPLREVHGEAGGLAGRIPADLEVHESPFAAGPGLDRLLNERSYSVFHFLGHAEQRPTGPALLLHGTESGEADPLYAEELAEMLARAEVRLAVLAACDTARGRRSLAARLVESGLAASIGMQRRLLDVSSPRLTGSLYEGLSEGLPLAAALTLARASLPEEDPDWAAPVLWVREGEENLSLGASAGSRAPFTVPFPQNPGFAGREALLEELESLVLPQPRRVVVLVGMGGAGKTQLAVEFAHRHRARFPGGVFWLDAGNSRKLQEDLASLGRFAGVPEELPLSERVARVGDWLTTLRPRALLVFDNAAEEIALPFPPAGNWRALVTSRTRHLNQPGFSQLRVASLERDASLRLLGGTGPLAPDERDAVEAVAAAVGDLPLALALAAHHVQRLGIGYREYLERIVQGEPGLVWLERARRRFSSSTGHEGALFGAIEATWNALPQSARDLLLVASCLAGKGIPRDLLRRLAAVPTFDEDLAELEDCLAVLPERGGRLAIHELIQSYAEGAVSPCELERAVERNVAVLEPELREANLRMGWQELRPNLPHLRRLAELAGRLALPQGIALHQALALYSRFHGELDWAQSHCMGARRLAERTAGLESLENAESLRVSAEILQDVGLRAEAFEVARRALEIARARLDENDPALGEFHVTAGFMHKLQGELDGAEEQYRTAIRLCSEREGYERTLATALNNLGTLYEARSDWSTARELLARALELDRARLGESHPRVATRLNNLGRVLTALGQRRESLALHRRAREIYRDAYGEQHMDTGMSGFYAVCLAAVEEPGSAWRSEARQAREALRRCWPEHHPVIQRLNELLVAPRTGARGRAPYDRIH